MRQQHNTLGIKSFGSYLPRLRLSKTSISNANSWFDSSLKGLARGERTMCNWDEDSITMAVEAGSTCLQNNNADSQLIALVMASTSMPFSDRQNSVLVAEALNIKTTGLRTMDVTSSQRAATSGLLAAFDTAAAGEGEVLLVASEHRRSRCGSREEMLYGDGAAAVSVGTGPVLAELVASYSHSNDFLDHYRGEGSAYDYGWEERWIREEGLLKIVPQTISELLSKTEYTAKEINHFIVSTDQARTPAAIAKKTGIDESATVDNLIESVGITGAAHPILLLVHCLEQASPGELVLVTSFGQGCDAMLFKVTDAIKNNRPGKNVSSYLASGQVEENYNKFQVFNNLVNQELGKRGEIDKQSYLSNIYRNRGLVNSFIGGKCSQCGTVQIPKMPYCVNPECRAIDTLDDYPMSRAEGKVKLWTADQLTFDFNPPAYFGMIEFKEGGRLMMDITEVDPETFDTGTEVSVRFRIKQIDGQRGFRRYFWKAIPT